MRSISCHHVLSADRPQECWRSASSSILQHEQSFNSFTATHLVDILTHATIVNPILGLINIAGIPSVPSAPSVITPLDFSGIFQSNNVTLFVSHAQRFMDAVSTSPLLSYDARQALLGEVVTQAVATRLLVQQRVQDVSAIRGRGQAGLPLLALLPTSDMLVDGDKVARYLQEEWDWKNLTIERLEGVDHLPWVSAPDEFRQKMLSWITSS